MLSFDVSKPWIILVSSGTPPALKAAGELKCCITLLRKQSGLPEKGPAIEDGESAAPEEDTPLLILNCNKSGKNVNGFSWRAASSRVEIFGTSPLGLAHGTFDFLSALGFSWENPGTGHIPQKNPDDPDAYRLTRDHNHENGDTRPDKQRRLFFTSRAPAKRREEWLAWAFRNRIDAVVFPLANSPFYFRGAEQLANSARDFGFDIEAGGWDLSTLVPGRKFFFHHDLFRMENGKRRKKINFCPTNHDTIALIREQAKNLFRRYPETTVFHLWPDRGKEETWCSCPACRAFSMDEQNMMAVNTAAGILEQLHPGAFISYADLTGNYGDIHPGQNTFPIKNLPGSPGAEDGNIFLAE